MKLLLCGLRNRTLAKILIFGNSGSGKSTLAKHLCKTQGLAHLDLDTLAWKPTSTPERKPIDESEEEIKTFISSNDKWVIEGCYTDLLKIVEQQSTEIIFMNYPLNPAFQTQRRDLGSPINTRQSKTKMTT